MPGARCPRAKNSIAKSEESNVKNPIKKGFPNQHRYDIFAI
jgi:hypothetical protein